MFQLIAIKKIIISLKLLLIPMLWVTNIVYFNSLFKKTFDSPEMINILTELAIHKLLFVCMLLSIFLSVASQSTRKNQYDTKIQKSLKNDSTHTTKNNY